jgi:gliding motility-associated-like protein
LQFPPLSVEITNGDILLDCNQSIDIFANATGGDGVYQYAWADEAGNNLFGWGNTLFYGSWNGEGQVNVTVTDGCGLTATDVVNVELNVPELIVNVPASIDVTCNTPYDFVVNPTGGEAPYNYSWQMNGQFDWMFWGNTYTITENEPGVLTVFVGDACGQNEQYDIPFQIVSPPVTFDLPAQVIGNCSTIFNVQPTNVVGSGGYTYEWVSNGVVISTAPVINNNFTQNTTLVLTIDDACSQSGQGSTQIIMDNPAINLSLGNDINASCLDNTFITPTLSGGSGGFEYTWIVADTVFSDLPNIQLQSFETVNVALSIVDNCGTLAADEISYNIPNIPITFVQHPDTVVCPGSDVNLFAIASGGEAGFEYRWVGTSQDSTHVRYNNLFTSFSATITATDICGKSNSSTINVTVAPVEAIFASQEVDSDRYRFTDYSTSLSEPIFLNWFINGELASSDPEFEYQFDGLGSNVVLLQTTNNIGCWDTTSTVIFSEPLVYIPTAFTPNGDGLNDAFFIKGGSIREFEFRVFDRWGNVVFESRDPETPWLGDFQGGDYYVTTGIYNYTLRVKGFKNEALEKTGTIQIVR